MNCASQLPSLLTSKKSFLLFFMLLLMSSAFPQGRLKGKIIDEKQMPVAFANVALMRSDAKNITAAVVTDSSGNFSIAAPAAGNYVFNVKALGFQELRTNAFDVSGPSFSKDLGSFQLKEITKKLNDVTVTSLRPTITQQADKMIVSVEGTAMAAGNTAFQVLSKTPGVFVDQDGNISLNGRSGVTVMLDGKQTYLSALDLKNLLESMPAENLKNIEIILNPSSKYDAEGTSGILNINLKKNTKQGINGSVFAGHNFNGKQHGFSAGANINYKKGKWNSYAGTDLAKRVGGREGVFTRVFDGAQQTVYFDQTTDGQYKNIGPPSVRIGSDYSINDKHSIGFNARFATNTGREEFFSRTYMGSAPKTPSTFIEASNFSKNTWTNYAGNLHYFGKLDSLGSSFSTDLDYVKITNKGLLNFYNYHTNLSNGQKTSDLLSSDVPNGFDIYAAKADYTKALKDGQKWEAGVKVSRVVSDNDFKFYINNGSTPVLDPKRTNHFYYKESIYAAYLNWSGKLAKNTTLQTGLRAENTSSSGISYTTNQRTDRNYLNLFPSIFLQQKISENYGFVVNYSRRLSRPNYSSLNPFRFYRDPYTWIQGNPYMRPQYSNVFTLTQTFKKNYILTLSYTSTKDAFSELPYLIPDSAQTIYYQGNANRNQFTSAQAIVPVRIIKNWDAMNTITFAYQSLDIGYDQQVIKRDQVFFSVRSNHTIVLPKSFRVEANMLYRGKAIAGLYEMDPWFTADLGIRKTFANKKFDLSFNVSDVFKSQRLKFQTRIGKNINDFDQYLRFRSFTTTLRYNFSKGIKTDSRRNNNLEEVGRAGGN